jgi:hypothetical protein
MLAEFCDLTLTGETMGTDRIYLEFDKTGTSPVNRILNEPHDLLGIGQRLVIPDYCSYYSDSLAIRLVAPDGSKTLLTKSQYRPVEHLHYISFQTNKSTHCGILILDDTLAGSLELDYQATGGLDQANVKLLKEAVDLALEKSIVDWKTLDHPPELPPSDHIHHVADLYHADPLIAAVKRIAQVVGLIDSKLEHKLLGNNVFGGFGQVFDVYDGAWDLRMRAMRLVCRDTKNILLAARQLNAFDQQAERVIREKLLTMRKQLTNYATNSNGNIYSMVLQDLVRQQYAVNKKVLDVPKLIPNLVNWVDLSVAVTGVGGPVATDKLTNQTWIVTTPTAPTPMPIMVVNPDLGTKVMRVGAGSYLTTTGSGITIGPNTTMFMVTARSNGQAERGVILTGPDGEVSIDIEAGELLRITQQSKITALVQSQVEDNYPAHLGVFVFGDDLLDSYCESNTIRSTYRGFNNYVEKPSITKQTYKQIGSAQGTQSVDIAEFIVYDRYLSKYEVDAIVEYLSVKYNGLSTNLIANGDFNDRLAEFETDYPLTHQATNPFEIACIDRVDLNVDGTRHYTTGLFEPALNLHVPGDRFLAVHQKYNVWEDQKMIWMQRHQLVRGQMYRFEFDLYFTKNQFPYLVLMDGTGRRIGCYPTNKTLGGVERISFGFMAREADCLLRLFSDSRSEVDFAIDHITLVRDFRMPVPFVSGVKTTDNVLSAITL